MSDMSSQTVKFGVNYLPRRNWFYAWVDWDPESIQEDLTAIAGLGCDHVRIHCHWPAFQPNPTFVSPAMLDRLGMLLEIAETAGLDVIVTVLDGWLSGFDFRPQWLGTANIFADELAIEAEKHLIGAIAERVGGRSNFVGFDLANEPNVLEPNPFNTTTQEQASNWVRSMLSHCSMVAPEKVHTVGMDHRPWLEETPFTRSALGEAGQLTTIHAWVYFTGALDRYGEGSLETVQLAPYMLELAKAYQPDGLKPVWLQEYGIAPTWLSDSSPVEFLESATRAALQVENLWGVTWWVSHDIDRTFSGLDELEYELGLFTVDNQLKPTGERLAEIIADYRQSTVVPTRRHIGIVLPDGMTPDFEFADRFFQLQAAGGSPALVLESRSSDYNYLALRGITELDHHFGSSNG